MRTPDEDNASSPGRRRLLLLAPLLPLTIAGLVWWFADLSALESPEKVAETARSLRDSPFGLLYVLLGFTAGTLLFLPVTALMAGTALAFDPLRGVAFGLLGALCGASITYWVGRLSGGAALKIVSGPRLNKIGHELRTHAFRASIIARLLPVGNFTVINLLAGSLRIPFRAFFLGNIIGILPGVLLIVLFAERISEALRNPDKDNLMLAGGVVAGCIALMVLLKQLSRRRTESTGDVAP
jgi:phospholipase D1/2